MATPPGDPARGDDAASARGDDGASTRGDDGASTRGDDGASTRGDDAGLPARGLIDFRALAGRLRVATGVLGALVLAACVVDGLRNGLTFALMARWAAVFVGTLVVVGAVLVALSALGGARTAHGRGERLRGDGTGLVPSPRHRRGPGQTP